MISLIVNVDDPNQSGLLETFASERKTEQTNFVISGEEISFFHRPVKKSATATQPWDDDWLETDAFEFAIGVPGEDFVAYSDNYTAATPGVNGTITVNTVEVAAAFADTTDDALPFVFSIKRTRVSGEVAEYYQAHVALKRSVINPGSAIPTPSASYYTKVESDARFEAALGNPSTSGYVLSSTTGGVRSWVASSGGGSGNVTTYGDNVFTATNDFGVGKFDPADAFFGATLRLADASFIMVAGDETGFGGYLKTESGELILETQSNASKYNIATGVMTGSLGGTLSLATQGFDGDWKFKSLLNFSDSASAAKAMLSSATQSSDATGSWTVTSWGLNQNVSADGTTIVRSDSAQNGWAFTLEHRYLANTGTEMHEAYFQTDGNFRPFLAGMAPTDVATVVSISNASPRVVTISGVTLDDWARADLRIFFLTLAGGSGLNASTSPYSLYPYYIKTVLTPTTFTISDSLGGVALNGGTAYTSGTVDRGGYGLIASGVPMVIAPSQGNGITGAFRHPDFNGIAGLTLQNTISGVQNFFRLENSQSHSNVIQFGPTSGNASDWGIGVDYNATNDTTFIFRDGSTGNLPFQLTYGATNKLAIGYTGLVTPATTLDVNGTVTATSVNTETILDSNGNEILQFFPDGVSAANHIGIVNSASGGGGPAITSLGDDTNVPLNVGTKGTGNLLLTSLGVIVPDGAISQDFNGAASKPAFLMAGTPFAGDTSTSFPLFYINDTDATASSTLNTAGTYFGINGNGTQDLMNLLKDGVSQLKVASDGTVTMAGSATVGGSTVLTQTGTQTGITNKTFVAPVLGAATGTSLALGGATIGSNALAWTGTAIGSGVATLGSVIITETSGSLHILRDGSNYGFTVDGGSGVSIGADKYLAWGTNTSNGTKDCYFKRTATSTITLSSDGSSGAGNLVINGTHSVSGAITGASLTLTAGTASTSTTTGALVIAGGLGVSGAANVGGLVFGSGGLQVAQGASIGFGNTIGTFGRGSIAATADGTWTIRGSDNSTFVKLSFGAATSARVALQTSGTTLTVGLGDGTAGGALVASGTLSVTGVATFANTTATPAGGSTAARIALGTTAALGVYYGSGAPSVTAAKGSLYLRSDGSGTSDRMYVATDSAGAWTAVTTAT